MSAECERVFSSAKHLLSDARNRLNPDIIEANECLKAWFTDEMKEEAQLAKDIQEAEEQAAEMQVEDVASDVEGDRIVVEDGEVVFEDL
ncbi:hypothetical protein H2201_008629 [Coniosporium apollinis]|uniref:HAT C-terminal dimerisation domain-containing protein n=2 Tax=Coniosporium TaxID=2810619 RepID=A0ABQ9NIF7_9PEZI|nr:hypothetical protein H2199_006346 [Cladosporium sp. JES 115]KAJ9656149.1 hypothetical protein H2201_008629 [Coniosporium apollinis]